MSKSTVIILVFLIVFLVSSLAGNGYLMYLDAENTKAIKSLQTDYNNTTGELEDVSATLERTQAELESVKAKLTSAQEDVQKTHLQRNELLSKLERMMCGAKLDANQLSGVTTNQSLIDPITAIVEKSYATQIIDTRFRLVWNNSKTAEFTLVDKDKTSVVVIVSWDFGISKIISIYDVNNSCFYYYPNK